MMKELELREPNNEQKEAIHHEGGVLLGAGAGSGKTFVLVEHIIHLFDEFCQKHEGEDKITFAKELKHYFSEIVLMTFTKKAAGELFLRMKKRFDLGKNRAQAGLERAPLWMWQEAEIALPYLYIGTIHGFCYRLINQGYISGLAGDEDMLSDIEFENKISNLIDQWLEVNFEELKASGCEHLILNKKGLKKNFIEIFSDTDIRILWSSVSKDQRSLDDEKIWIEKGLEMVMGHGWKEHRIEPSLFRPDSKKIPQWFNFLEQFSTQIEGSKDVIDFISRAQIYFDNLSRFPSVKEGKVDDEVYQYFQKTKLLRDFLKSNYQDYKSLIESFEAYQLWTKKIIELYAFVEKQYFQEGGLTFTDLEFYVWKCLNESEQAVEQVSSAYNYFIIDEFQDTSMVQFSIVREIIGNDMKRVFSVGDVKQAIYGFRGGELGVFQEASEKTYQNLTLRNNYRSAENIIAFNNGLFENLLPLGKDYVGDDEFSVPMVKQDFPEGKDQKGVLQKHALKVFSSQDDKKSLSATELNFLESKIISGYINENDEEIAVLYRKLSPTKYLIPELMKNDSGFTCQVKVDLEEDPFLCLFLEYSRACVFYQDNKRDGFRVLNYILNKMGLDLKFNIEALDCYFEKESRLGLMESFKEFLWAIGFSSSNLNQTFSLVKVLKELSGDRASVVFEYSKSFLNGNYSLDFQYGKNPQRVKIMTVHASKGLEFQTVILGGIHSNGSSKSGGGSFGKLPFSLKWMAGLGKTDTYKSPAFIYEQEINKRKDFSEFKRLFYVATTRAVDKLFWVDIEFNEKPASYSKSSWINGLRLFEETSGYTEIFTSLKGESVTSEVLYEQVFGSDVNLSFSLPMFHRDGLGVYLASRAENDLSQLGIGAELSVTKLAVLSQCPRKFFLKNILKLDKDEVGSLFNDNSLGRETVVEEESTEAFSLSSSKNRGSLVHLALEHAFKHNFVLPLEHELDSSTQGGAEWVINQIQEHFPINQLVSEEPMKFSFFGQMISGIPDLIINDDQGEVLEIWDFKTGRYQEKKCVPYWFQLKTYAFALLKETEKPEKKVKLVLAFVDEKLIKDVSLTLAQIEDDLYKVWKDLENLDQINKDHCPTCEYKELCFPH